MGKSFILYSNRLSRPIASDGVTNVSVLASTIIGRRATLAPAGAYVDFRFRPVAGIRSVGVAGIHTTGTAAPSVMFAFSAEAPGAAEIGFYSFTPVPDGVYRTDARVLEVPLASAQYCRVSFYNCTSVGRCWAGQALNPKIGIGVGATRRWVDMSVVTQSDLTGAATVSRRPKYRQAGVKFAIKDIADYWDFDDMVTATGESEEAILVAGLSEDRPLREVLFGRLINLSDSSYVQPLLQEWPFEFRETL